MITAGIPSAPTIVLSVKAVGDDVARSLLSQVFRDGHPIATNQAISAAQLRSLHDASRRYLSLFDGQFTPLVDSAQLEAFGAELCSLWLAPVWPQLMDGLPAGTQRLLVVASDVPEVLNLPWELLRPPGGDGVALGLNPLFSVRRLPRVETGLPVASGPLPGGPLRVLFMACAPTDQPGLDFEREEELIQRAVGANVQMDVADLGTFTELQERVSVFRPHVVHLTGHGALQSDGLAYFAFEDERGKTDLISSVKLRQQVLAGSGVQCVFVSGCQSAQASNTVTLLGGLCQGLVGAEVPLAIGFTASVEDRLATTFATTFYRILAAGQSVDRALVLARQALHEACQDRAHSDMQNTSWTLPVLYAATAQQQVIDQRRPPESQPRPSTLQLALPGMTEGYAEHFVGRRREQQELLSHLRDGSYQIVLLTGLGGEGKSTLATRLARRLESDGFVAFAIPASEGKPLNAERVLELSADAFLAANLVEAHQMLRNPDISATDRLHYVVTTLNRSRFVFVLDNLETNLDDSTHAFLDPELTAFYTYLLANLAGGSRVLITSRYRPAVGRPLPPLVREVSLSDFSQGEFLKLLLRHPVVERRYRTSDLPPELLRDLYRKLGGTPRFLNQMAALLTTIDAAELQSELASISLPNTDGTEPGQLQRARDTYCEKILTDRLYSYLVPGARTALSRAAVYNLPVTLEALAAVSELSVEQIRTHARSWQEFALAYAERGQSGQELWTIYGVLRSWLLAPERLDTDQRQAAHKHAGTFLRELERQDREGELGQSWIDCLLEARGQFLAADEISSAIEITSRLSDALLRRSSFEQVRRLNLEVLEHVEDATALAWLGRVARARGMYPDAQPYFERALAIHETALGPDHPHTAASLNSVGLLLQDQGDLATARPYLERALAIYEKVLGPDHAYTAACLNNLGLLLVDQSDLAAARPYLERALAIYEKVLGPDHPDTAVSLSNLGSLRRAQGDLAAARAYFERALAIREKVVGPDHLDTAISLSNLGSLLQDQSELAAAQASFERALAIFENVLGSDHPTTATGLNNLGGLWRVQGDLATAQAYFERALAIREKALGPDHPDTAISLSNLGSLRRAQGDLAAARAYLERALAIREKALGPDHLDTGISLSNLGGLLENQSELAAARPYFLRALAIYQARGDRYREGATFHGLGSLAFRLGRKVEGARLVAVCYLIDQEIGHADVEQDMRNLTVLTEGLDYSAEQRDKLVSQVRQTYPADRGWDLIRDAFPGMDAQSSGSEPQH